MFPIGNNTIRIPILFDVFDQQGDSKKDFDHKRCNGLKVKPRQGDGLLFYSVFPNGTIDQVLILSVF